MSAEWNSGLCGCFSNCSICIITFLAPCVTLGKVAEGVDDSFCYACVCSLVPIVNLVLMILYRGKVRSKQNIEGGLMGDFCTVWWCMPCALCQMGIEAEFMQGNEAAMSVEMERA